MIHTQEKTLPHSHKATYKYYLRFYLRVSLTQPHRQQIILANVLRVSVVEVKAASDSLAINAGRQGEAIELPANSPFCHGVVTHTGDLHPVERVKPNVASFAVVSRLVTGKRSIPLAVERTK